MSNALTKPIRDLTSQDLDDLCKERVVESEVLELNREVPWKSESQRWSDSSSKLSDYAKREMLKEVVALANAFGGHYLIGVSETSDDPPRAGNVTPVAACGKLETTLDDVLRNSIDPPLPSLEIGSVPYGHSQTNGVVIVRVPRSRLRPHRSTTDRQVWVRIRRSTVAIGMRDIQDRVLQSRTELETVEGVLQNHLLTDPPGLSMERATATVLATAVPLGGQLALPMRPYEYKVDDQIRRLIPFQAVINGKTERLDLPQRYTEHTPFVPRLRGAVRHYRCQHKRLKTDPPEAKLSYDVYLQEIGFDGLVETSYQHSWERGVDENVWDNTIAAVAANTVFAADSVRHLAGLPGVGYLLQVQVKFWPPHHSLHPGVELPRRPFNSFTLPPVSFFGPNLNEPLKTIYDDLQNLSHDWHTDTFEVNWPYRQGHDAVRSEAPINAKDP